MAMRQSGRGAGRRPPTPSRQGVVGVQPVYEDFRPISEWQQDKESDVLLIYLPGFQKQHLKVSTEGQNMVRARGERLDVGNKWSRFQEDYQVPERCNIGSVRARFEGGILTITMPWRKDIQTQDKRSKQTLAPTQPIPSAQLPDAQKESPISPLQQVKESLPQKAGSENNPPKGQFITSPQPPMESIPEKGLDDIPSRVRSPPLLLTPSKDAKETGPQKVSNNNITSNVVSLPAKLKDEERFSEPLSQMGQDEKKDSLLTHPPNTPKSFASIQNNAEPKKDETSDIKGKSEEDEPGINEKNKGPINGRIKNPAREYRNEETENRPTTAVSGAEYGLRSYKRAVKSLAEANEERQLLLNVGAAVLVIVALGTYIISSTIGSGESKN